MVRGQTKNIAIQPLGNKSIDAKETILPSHIDLRNGRLNNAGNWEKRPGYDEWRLTNILKPVTLLLPIGNGYAMTSTGRIFDLTSDNQNEIVNNTILSGTDHPQWVKHNDYVIICNGGHPINLIHGGVSYLAGSPPAGARFVVRVGDYTLMSGYKSDVTEFAWCAANNPENWTTGDSGNGNISDSGNAIRNTIAIRDKVYHFHDKGIEVWVYIGGSNVFVRHDGLYINRGIGADYSAIFANDTIYWYGDDHKFYVLNNGSPQVISHIYKNRIESLSNPSEIYGFDLRKEGVIRWLAPTDHICMVYDYINNNWSEDNEWLNGDWSKMRIGSYMELKGEQYFGDTEPTGKIYRWSRDYLNDNGNPIRVYRNMKLIPSSRGNKIRYNRMGFRIKRGVSNSNDSTPEMFWRYKLDEGNWSNYSYLDIGATAGDYDPWLFETNLGVGREIDIEVVHTDAVDDVLTHMNLTMEELGR